MCKWFCTSTGPSTSLKCLHCGAGYCGACLHGEGGKMESLIKCSSCGKKPRTQGAAKRGTWKAAPGPDATSSSVGNESEVGVKNVSPGTGTRSIGNDPTQEKLAGVFDQYCKFSPASTALDNVKWFKCVSELDLVDNKSLTRADVDLIFTKVKAKGERRINFQGFRDALSMVARKKNGVNDGEGDEVELLGKLLAGKLNVSNQVTASTGDDGKTDAPASASPTAAGGEKKSPAKKKATGKSKTGAKTGVKSPGAKARSPKASPAAGGNSIFDKLTDSSQYTGSHKHRFDSDGKGRGLAGRDSLSKGGVGGAYHGGAVNDLSQIMRTNLHQAPAKGSSPNAAKDTEMTKSSISGSSPKKSPKKKDGPSIFDKLTDASQYTGAHKHRFDSTGKGRGLAGRDSGGVERGGKVSDLSQITNRK